MFAKKASGGISSEVRFTSRLKEVQERSISGTSGSDAVVSPSKAALRRELSIRGRILDTWGELCREYMLLELYVTEEKLPGRDINVLNLKDASMVRPAAPNVDTYPHLNPNPNPIPNPNPTPNPNP